MADEEKCGELCSVHLCRAENGWKICCCFEGDKDKLSVRAGWCPPMCTTKDYVEKTSAAVLSRLKEILK